MKKIILIMMCFVCTSLYTKAQSQNLSDTTENDTFNLFLERWDTCFSGLNYSLIPTGMLRDYSLMDLMLEAYNGKADSIIDIHLIKQLYNEIESITLDKSKSPIPFDTIENRALSYRNNGINPIVVFDYKYNTFHDSAFAWNLIDTSNNKVIDVAGRSLSPYNTENVFAISPFYFSIGRDTNITLYLGKEMYIGNDTNTLNNLEVNFGQGWQTLSQGLTTINLPTTGVVDISIRCNPNSSSQNKNSFKLAAVPSIKDLGADFYFSNIIADIKYSGITAEGQYVYRLGKGNSSGCFKKPFIITDGIDFGYETDKASGWERCVDGKCNSLGFIDIYTGWDHDYGSHNNYGKKIPEFAQGQLFFDNLYNEGYDVIFLDYKSGAGHMEANAMLVVKMINYINANKCGNEELVICGPSMGGQIVRYALAYMETNKMKHCVRTAVYFDSPNKGANIPIGLQLFVKYFKEHNYMHIFDDCATTIDQKLDRPAAKQLLLNHCSTSDNGITNLRKNFTFELENNLGSFPKKIRQVAIPNGSCKGYSQSFTNGANIIDMDLHIVNEIRKDIKNKHKVANILFWRTINITIPAIATTIIGGFDIRGVSYATAGNDNIENRIFYGDAAYYNNKQKVNWSPTAPTYDNSPGSENNALSSFKKLLPDGNRKFVEAVSAPYDYSTFIPTMSALALNSNDLYYDIQTQIIDPDMPAPSKYPFDAFYNNNSNGIHVEMTNGKDGNIAWLINELKRTENLLTKLPVSYKYYSNSNQDITINAQTYNFCNHFRHTLPDVEINSGGKLKVNAASDANFGATDEEYNANVHHYAADYFQLNTSDCGSEVSINNGGTFTIGDNNSPINNKGVVYIKDGSNLYLNNGSKLYLYWGSKLIIEEGATLFIEPGAEIYLEDAASIEIKGGLKLLNNANFKPNGPGKVIFDNSNNTFALAAGNNTSIEIKSTNNENKLEVSGNIVLPTQLNLFTIDGAIVTANDGSKFNIYAPVYIDKATFKPSSTNVNNNWGGLKFYNQYDNNIHIDQSKFYYATTALDFSNDYALSSPKFYADEFYNNNLAISIHDAGFTMNSCLFKSNTKAINANWITNGSVIQGCKFSDNNLGIDYQGNINATLLLKNNNILGSDIDIISPASNPFLVTLSCNKFTNTGIEIQYASVNISSSTLHNNSDYGGYNIFKESPLSLYNVAYLNLKDGYNDFIMVGNNYISGSIKNANNLNNSQVNKNYFDRINGGNYPLPTGIPYNTYFGKLNLTYTNANTQASSTFKLYGTLSSQKTGGCQAAGGGGFAPTASEYNKAESVTTTTLYPNPTESIIKIELPASDAATTISIIDLQGKTIYNGYLTAGTTLYTMPVKDLPAGIYMVLLQHEGLVERLKFVKQ